MIRQSLLIPAPKYWKVNALSVCLARVKRESDHNYLERSFKEPVLANVTVAVPG